MSSKTIKMQFDKSHILTIGRKMYSESINLIRELVNNSYDADATKVKIELSTNRIIVSDNGSGMDFKGIQQYFTIGSPKKKELAVSQKFKRKMIGEIGIGKFSSLGATNKFELSTIKNGTKIRVVFDHIEWQQNESDWEIPYSLEKVGQEFGDGTQVILHDVVHHFTPQEVADRLRTSVPLDAKNFEVFINGVKLEPINVKGKRVPVHLTCEYGEITGHLILADKSLPFNELGVMCCVKDVMITRSLFGYEDYGHGSRRITGKVNADFLEFTSDRNDFLINTNEYKVFYKLMNEEVKKLVKRIKNEEDEKKIEQSKRALSKATQILRHAFKQLPDYLKHMKVEVSKSHKGKMDEQDIPGNIWRPKKEKSKSNNNKKEKNKRDEYNIAHITPLTESKVIKNIKTDLGFNFGFVNEGDNGPVSYYYNGVIYVNRQHALYQKFSKKLDDEIRHLVNILIAEAIMLTSPADLRQYYERQMNVLLKANT